MNDFEYEFENLEFRRVVQGRTYSDLNFEFKLGKSFILTLCSLMNISSDLSLVSHTHLFPQKVRLQKTILTS